MAGTPELYILSHPVHNIGYKIMDKGMDPIQKHKDGQVYFLKKYGYHLFGTDVYLAFNLSEL